MGCQSSKATVAEPHSANRTLLAKSESQKQAVSSGVFPISGTGETSKTSAHSNVISSSISRDTAHAGTSNMRTHRTLVTDRHELDVMVSQFTAHDSTVGSAISRNWQEKHWKVTYDLDAPPVDIKLQVQEHKLHSHEVAIESDGKAIFHGAGSHAKAKMTEDFSYQWPFRASIRGINEVNYFELRPSRVNPDEWIPATITRQREDGFFEVSARQLEERGYLKDAQYPAVHRDDLREAASKKPILLPESSLMLRVPKQDPIHSQLSMGGELITHHFGKPSPPTLCNGEEKPKISLRVSKDRSKVDADVGHDVLSHFQSGQVRAEKSEVERLMHSWTIQAGPFARHSIKVSKNYTLGKIITLMVDGEVFVEASAADLACSGNVWQCNFRFVGEKTLDFEVFKTNSNGYPLDDTAHVEQKQKYMHECTVVIPNDRDFSTAQFLVDGVDFRELPQRPQYQEPTLSMDPRVFTQTYGIPVPYKVDPNAPSTFVCMAQSILSFPESNELGNVGISNFFTRACMTSPVANVEAEVCVSSRESL